MPPRLAPLSLARLAVLAGCALTLGAVSPQAGRGVAGGPVPVHPAHAFGLQNIPKFDERAGHGAWNGTRARGLAMRRDVGASIGREGLMWSKFQPNGPQPGPYMADFDDAVNSVHAGGMDLEAMVTETPGWASTARDPKHTKDAPPRGLADPVFADQTDTPAPGKAINPANTWAQALGALAERYHGRVRYWQVWNEPDYPQGKTEADERDERRSWTGSVDEYVRLLHVSRLVLRSRDPQALIATGGLGYAGYLDAMLARGAAPDFDMVDFHAYGWPGSDAALEAFERVHAAMADVLARHGAHKGMICSETGYSASEPLEQAAYLAKLFPTALALGVSATMVYADSNPCWRNMGLVDWRTMTQRTAGYWSFKHATAALHDVRTAAPLNRAGLVGYRFERADHRPLYVVWAPHATRPGPVTLAVGPGTWQLHDAEGRPLGRQAGPAVHLALGTAPCWVDGDERRAYVAPRANPPIARAGLALASATADSSAEATGGPGAAIDGDPDTQWTNADFRAAAAWLRVALPQPARVGRLKIKTGPTPARTWFDVETSLDGRSFVTAAAHVQLQSWHMEEVPLAHPAEARFLRLVWHNPDRTPAHFGVFELEAVPAK